MEDITSYLSQTDAPDSQTAETLDARELPPPQPLKNTLEQLTEIDDSVVLVQLNDRRPQHLYPELDDRGYEYETLDIDNGIVTVIWKI